MVGDDARLRNDQADHLAVYVGFSGRRHSAVHPAYVAGGALWT
jgi:hypothetical protein